MDVSEIARLVSIWALPVLIAITFHEAAHGFAARALGDDTAERLGRLSLNPIRHIDPFGTVILPGLLILLKTGFLFGWAKPVPVDTRRLRSPRRDMAWVAAAGPGSNILLAALSMLGLAVLVDFSGASTLGLSVPEAIFLAAREPDLLAWFVEDPLRQWIVANLSAAVLINVFLAVFNMLPLPPLDGSRIVTALLPLNAAIQYVQLERYGFLILFGLFLAPQIGDELGIDLNWSYWLVARPAFAVIEGLLWLIPGI